MTKHPVRTLSELFLFFLAASVLGWLYEVFLEVVVYRWGFSNRGVLTGPYCVVYGVGALLLLLCLHRLMARRIPLGRLNLAPLVVFVGIVLIATLVELAASYLMEWATGGWMWNYERFRFNFQGRIAPNPSLRFGAGGMVLLYGLLPLLRRLSRRLSARVVNATAALLASVFCADCVYTFLLK